MIRFLLVILFLTLGLCVPSAAQDRVESSQKPTEKIPVSYGFVVDNSGSFRTLIDKVITVVSDVVEENEADDEAFLVTFVDTPKIVLRQEFTFHKSELHDAAQNMFIEGGKTAILDAIKSSADYLVQNARTDPGRGRAARTCYGWRRPRECVQDRGCAEASERPEHSAVRYCDVGHAGVYENSGSAHKRYRRFDRRAEGKSRPVRGGETDLRSHANEMMSETAIQTAACASCGAEVRDESVFCYNCGDRVKDETANGEEAAEVNIVKQPGSRPPLRSAALLRKQRRAFNRQPLEVSWEQRTARPTGFVITTGVIVIGVLILLVLALYLR